MRESYKEYKERIAEKQSGMSKEQIAEQMKRRNQFMLDLDSLTPQTHNWTDRGLKHTCENAGHPYHEAWKARKHLTKA